MPPKRGAAKAPPAKEAPARGAAKAKAAAEAPKAPARAKAKAKAEEPEAAEPQEDYDSWPVAKLKARCQELGLTNGGSKTALVERLKTCAPAAAKAKAVPAPTRAPPSPEPAAKRGKAAAASPKAKAGKRGEAPAPAAEEPPAKKAKAAAKAPASSASAPAAPPPTLEEAEQTYYEDGEFAVEYAKSSRSACRRCREKIAEGSVRIGKVVQSQKFDGKETHWHHLQCFLGGGLLPRSSAMINGFSNLRPEDQKTIKAKLPSDDGSGATGASGVSDSAMKKQTERVFTVKDALKELSENQLKEMLALNDYPTKKFGVSATPLDLCADGVVFGGCVRCTVCADDSKEEEKHRQGGSLLLDGECYRCTGWVNQYLKCSFKTQTPERKEWQMTDAAKSAAGGKLGRMKFKTGDRLFNSKLQLEEGSASASASAPPKPPLLGFNITVEQTESESTDSLKQLIRRNGGTISETVTKATTCVISTAEAVEAEAEYVGQATELGVPGVTEEFVKATIAAGAEEDMTPYLLWGEARRRRTAEAATTKYIQKMGVAMDADVGEEVAGKAHVLVDRSMGRVYSEMLTLSDLVSGANSFYTLHLLESDDGAEEGTKYWVFRKWGRIGVSCGGTKLEEFGSNKDAAMRSFCKTYLEKTNNTFGHKPGEFVQHTGKFVRVDVAHKALQKKGAEKQSENSAEGDGDGGGEEGDHSQPLGQLSKAQIEKADKVLDRIDETIREGGAGAAANVKFMTASAEYYSLVPHNFGLSKPPTINTEDLLGAERALLQFYMRMGFEEISGEDEAKLAPIAGVMEMALPKTLAEACAGVCSVKDVKSCVTKGNKMFNKKAGKPKTPMTADLYGALLLYTSNAIYKELNKALRDEDRDQVKKYFSYLRMLFEACDRLPTQACTLWRGVSVDLYGQYKVGSTITWWGVSSCTSNQKVAQDFTNGCGDKSTLLTVETTTACNISEVSFYANESESILLPGTQLEVISAERKGKQAHIKLREVGRAVG